MRIIAAVLISFLATACAGPAKRDAPPALVIMTDFGLKDGAVSAMKGVAYETAPGLVVADLTHEIPPYNIWEGSFRLVQTYKYWPKGTVFVTVVDPGVGSERHSIVMKSKSGHYFVGPDNGLYTLVADQDGVDQVRIIDESKQRLKGSGDSYTFHGRDLYVYVGARLASGLLKFEDSGSVAKEDIVRIPYQKASAENGALKGVVPVLDPQYGNVWTNIPRELVRQTYPDVKNFRIVIKNKNKAVYDQRLPLTDTFAGVAVGKPLLYFNSLLNLSVALNQGDFAKANKVGSGPEWTVSVEPAK
jgi:S-adenosylmethionine hydrolase